MFSQSYLVDEKLTYRAGFRVVSAGESTLELTTDSLGNKRVYHIESTVSTNSFLDIFYKVRDKIDVWVDQNDFSLYKTKKNIKEGKYKYKHEIDISYDTTLVDNDKQQFLTQKVFDPISIIYYLRLQILNIGQQFILPIFDGKSIKEIAVSVVGNENVSVPAGKFDCIFVAPSSTDGSKLLKNNGEMKIWFSNDSLKLPVKIEQQTNIGTMVLELKNVKRH
jgi:hypothetical protein